MAASGGGARPPTLVPGLYTDYLPRALRGRERDFFGYEFESLPLGAGGTANPTQGIDSTADFLVTSIAGAVRDPADVTILFEAPPITLQIVDTAASRNLFSAPVDWVSVVGTGQLPAFLPYPKIIARSSVVRIDLQNLDAANTYDVRLVLEGFKIFGTRG